MQSQANMWGGGPPSSAALTRLPSVEDVDASWRPVFEAFWEGAQGRALHGFLHSRLSAGAVMYPPQPLRMLQLTPLSAVRVVIVGQDPYHGAGQAEGLAFSVAPGVRIPPSLRNMQKEVWRSLGQGAMPKPVDGSLVAWARQGVLLLNSCLTVEEGLPASHAKQGWEVLTRALLDACVQQRSGVVFMLWGSHAQSLLPAGAARSRHLVLTSNHPSPLAAARGAQPFVGNDHFSRANQWLTDSGHQSINWLEIFQKTVA
jgi:uracil-DNA glycosylase